MPSEELLQYADRARQQSEVFLQRSREQMMAAAQAQQAGMGQGMSYFGGVTQTGGGGGYPMAGSPAGRLLETITDLARRGAMMGGSTVGGPISSAGQAAGAVGGLIYGNQPFGTGGINGGAAMGSNRGLGVMQTLYTAIGPNLPPLPLLGDIGRWAGQRMDMERSQAQQMASDELKYRTMGALQGGALGAMDVASFGMSGYMLRRSGVGLETTGRQAYARTLQSQLRYLTKESLAAGGAGEYGGEFSTGINRQGAMAALEAFAPRMGEMQREMGLSRKEIENIQGRAFGTMGTAMQNDLFSKGGFGKLAAETTKQSFAVRDIQRTLNIDEKDANEFFQTMGEVYGTADRIAKMAHQAEQHAGRWGMNKRAIFDMMREFEDVGRTTAIGAERARNMGMNFVEQMRGQQRLGIIDKETLFMYGGRTSEEALGIQARVQTQRNIGMLEQGRLGGLDVMMRSSPGAYSRFMGGGMGEFEIAGEVGSAYARNPLAGLEARYDPNVRAQAGKLGMTMQFQRVMGMKERGLFMFGGEKAEMIRQFETFTGLPPMEAARWFNVYQKQQDQFGKMAKGMKGDTQQHARNIQNIYTQLQAQGLTGIGAKISGDPQTAALEIYKQATANGTKEYDSSTSLEENLRKVASVKGETTEQVAAGLQRAGGGLFSAAEAGMGGNAPGAWRDVRRLTAAYVGTIMAPVEAVTGTIAEGIGSLAFGVNKISPMMVTSWAYRGIRGSEADEKAAAARGRITSKDLGGLTGFLRDRGVGDAAMAGLILGANKGQTQADIMYTRKAGLTRSISNFIGGVFGGGGGGDDDISLALTLTAEGDIRAARSIRGERVAENIKLEDLSEEEQIEVSKRLGASLGELSDPAIKARKIKELQDSGQMTTKENNLFRVIQMEKAKGFMESVWGEDKAPTSLYEFAKKLALSEGDTVAKGRIGTLSEGMLGFQKAYGYSGDQFHLKSLEALTDIFGEKDAASSISAALTAAGVGGWDVGKVQRGLSGKNQRLSDDLLEAASRGNVATEVLGQMTKINNLENAGAPMGSENRPMWIKDKDREPNTTTPKVEKK